MKPTRKLKVRLLRITFFLTLCSTIFMWFPVTVSASEPETTALPWLAVEPEHYTAFVGETFSVNVTINNLNASSQLTGVNFRLCYNLSLLEAVGLNTGTFLEGYANPPNGGVYYIYHGDDLYWNAVVVGMMILPDGNGAWHAPFPSGNGTLCTIVFEVKEARSPAGCELRLEWTKLWSEPQEKEIDHDVKDHTYYELHEMISHSIKYGKLAFNVVTVSNSSISILKFDEPTKLIIFNVTVGPNWSDTRGFCNITIPKELLGPPFIVLMDSVSISFEQSSNATHTSLYFVYEHSTHPVQIEGTTAIPDHLKDIAYVAPQVQVDVGGTHFRGELAEFYILTAIDGVRVDSTSISADLYKPDGSTEALAVEYVGTGFCKIQYSIPGDAATGTYALVVDATDFTIGATAISEAMGTSFKCFLLSSTLTTQEATIQDIKDEIATVMIPDLGVIKANLTAINAKLDAINGTTAWIDTNIGIIKTDIANIKPNITAIKETTVAIETIVGTIYGNVTEVQGDIATIETKIGPMQTDIANIKESTEDIKGGQATLTIPVYAGMILALIAAVAAALILEIIRRKT